MKFAADFRQMARDVLKGRWGIAILAGFLAGLLGAVDSTTPQVQLRLEGNRFVFGLEILGQTIFSTDGGAGFGPFGELITSGVILLAVISAIALFILGCVLKVGYSRFNLDLVDRQAELKVNSLFSYFGYWKNAVGAGLLQAVYIFLWTLLFIIPGIVAGYSYAMAGYILAENPQLSGREAIALSKRMMYGNRWRLFCLNISFIGWDILCVLTMGIGELVLNPYKQAALAAFYRDVSAQWRTYEA